MNKEQYLRYVIILVVVAAVVIFNQQKSKESPDEMQSSKDIRSELKSQSIVLIVC